MKISHVRIFSYLFLFFFLVAGCTVIKRQVKPHITREIQDEDSELLSVLLTEADFPAEWHWYSIYTKQAKYDPSIENNHLLEEVIGDFLGFYITENTPVSIWQILKRYKDIPPVINPNSISFGPNIEGLQTFNLPIDNSDIVKCLDMGEDVKCIALTNYGNISIEIELTVYENAKREVIQEWISDTMQIILGKLSGANLKE